MPDVVCRRCKAPLNMTNIPPTEPCYACHRTIIDTCDLCGNYLYVVNVRTSKPVHMTCMATHPSIADDEKFRLPARAVGGTV